MGFEPGVQAVREIHAVKDTRAEEVLWHFAKPGGKSNPSNNPRLFENWREEANGARMSRGQVIGKNGGSRQEVIRPVTLWVVAREEDLVVAPGILILMDASCRFSLKPMRHRGDAPVLGIPRDLCDVRIPDVTNQISAAWVVKGTQWTNSRGDLYVQPYGAPPQNNSGRRSRSRLSYSRFAVRGFKAEQLW